MSYPGGNGISLDVSELELKKSPNIETWHFLSDAVGYGDLVVAEHTTKNKTSETRRKFYLNPILSPTFQLPAAHTKEPLYWRLEKLLELARESELGFAIELQNPTATDEATRQQTLEDPRQMGLF